MIGGNLLYLKFTNLNVNISSKNTTTETSRTHDHTRKYSGLAKLHCAGFATDLYLPRSDMKGARRMVVIFGFS
jgi:hypothetical protein